MQATITESTFSTPQSPVRYLSLDVLRGLTVALMIVVNTPGSWSTIFAPFKHAEWHGFTITDLVFPTFLFVVGNAMSFSMKKFEQQPDSVFLKKVFKRTIIIFLLGLFSHLFPFVKRNDLGEIILKDFTQIRILGVLPRIALCYCLASLAIHYLKKQGAIILSVIILLGYWALMYFFGTKPDPYSLQGNAALKFDLLLFSPNNLYKGFGIPFDPEGLFSTFPAVVNVIAGYITGNFIQKKGNNLTTIIRLLFTGLALVCLALIWDRYFPINKPLWTSSYVVHSTGLDLIILSVLLWIIEIVGFRKWTYFFQVFGKNPLFIFVMSGLLIKTLSFIRIGEKSLSNWLYTHLFLTWSEGKTASLLFAISYMLLLWLLGYWMDKKKIYIRV